MNKFGKFIIFSRNELQIKIKHTKIFETTKANKAIDKILNVFLFKLHIASSFVYWLIG